MKAHAESYWYEDNIKRSYPDAECEEVKLKCEALLCSIQTTGFKNKVALLLPNKTMPQPGLRLHFHGHTQNDQGKPLTSKFDKDLLTLVKAFEMQKSACLKHSELVIIPWSNGKSTDFDKTFIKASIVQNWLEAILASLNIIPNSLHLSAHSGGGRTIKRILDTLKESTFRIDTLSMMDTFYTNDQATSVFKWIRNNPNSELNVFTLAYDGTGKSPWKIQGPSPFTYFKNAWIKEDLPQLKSQKIILNEKAIFRQSQPGICWLILESSGFDHWTLARETWGI